MDYQTFYATAQQNVNIFGKSFLLLLTRWNFHRIVNLMAYYLTGFFFCLRTGNSFKVFNDVKTIGLQRCEDNWSSMCSLIRKVFLYKQTK